MRKLVTACVLIGMLVLVAAAVACGGATNQTETPGEPTSAAPLPSVSPTGGGNGGGDGQTGTPAADGQPIFASNCSSCHGENGQGGFGPNLTNQQDVAYVQQTVTNGRGQMPAFGDELSPEEIQAVAQYVVNEL